MPLPSDKPCENGGISIGLLLIVSVLVVIVLSTVDFHTALVWDAPPRVNAEIRYLVTILGISIIFVHLYCQNIQIRARLDNL